MVAVTVMEVAAVILYVRHNMFRPLSLPRYKFSSCTLQLRS